MSDDKEALGHCVLCGKKSNGRVEDIAAEIVNRDILAGDVAREAAALLAADAKQHATGAKLVAELNRRFGEVTR